MRLCSSARDLADARRIHAGIVRAGLGSDKRVVDQLIQMYGSVGSAADARAVFEGFAAASTEPPDAFLWTAIITAFSRNGDPIAARAMFDRMPEPKHPVPTNAMLAAYAKNALLEDLSQFFSWMRDRSIFSWNTILAAYAGSLAIDAMELVFTKIPERNVISWNTIVTAYAEARDPRRAKNAFDATPERSIVSWNAIAEAFAVNSDTDATIQAFDRMPQHNRVSWTATFLARADHRPLEEIKHLFDRIPVREPGTWTVIVVRCSKSSQPTAALELLDRMPQWNIVSLNAALHSRSMGDLESAMAMFSQLPERDSITWNVMLNAFARLGFLDRARETFDRMPQWHLACFIPSVTASLAAIRDRSRRSLTPPPSTT
ncbi:pentatricopeptide repeat-containing protein At4g02750-like [Selaginella moellendorffii]|uniref:pentatricopeptide repeat-containing protein At4g02750-like n=1 Tax=Selaginella moellendorffii TaxID=88036 RepID=UPI000D1C5825|nr:pentatricopeptide repeat-containing protein At4g02750-like [Selaginella moellendorffii]|eukprot:XP_024544013.1 pentatricopeptide repeat-containing protein At4g02750-like [Selaginella moellendorffii]